MLAKGDKFNSRVRKTVLVGYEKTQKGYRLYDLDAGTFHVSRDVSFRENIFPFKGANGYITDIFCHSLYTDYDQVDNLLIPENEVCIPPNEIPTQVALEELNILPSSIEHEALSALDEGRNAFPFEESEQVQLEESEQVQAIRSSSRTSRPPIWLKDYMVPKKTTEKLGWHDLEEKLQIMLKHRPYESSYES